MTISCGLCWNIDSRKIIWPPRAHFGSENESLKGLMANYESTVTYYAFFMSLKVVTLRDLTNVQVSMKLSRDGNNVATVVDHLKSMDGMFNCIYVKPCGCLCFCEVVV